MYQYIAREIPRDQLETHLNHCSSQGWRLFHLEYGSGKAIGLVTVVMEGTTPEPEHVPEYEEDRGIKMSG